MSLEPGFGIELSMLVEPDGAWQHVYTYYNHGLEPPYGGVKSEETGGDLVVSVGMFDKIMRWTEEWIGYVRGIVKNPSTYSPDLPLEYSLDIQDNGDVVLALNITMETLDSYFSWSKDTGMVTFKARQAFDLSWEGFLFYWKAMNDFSAKIKER